MSGCLVAQQEKMWFYCPATQEYYKTRAQVPFCGDFAQQAICGSKGLEIQSQQSGLGGRGDFNPQSVTFPDVAGTGRARGGNHQ